jgi:hypothetical protein
MEGRCVHYLFTVRRTHFTQVVCALCRESGGGGCRLRDPLYAVQLVFPYLEEARCQLFVSGKKKVLGTI